MCDFYITRGLRAWWPLDWPPRPLLNSLVLVAWQAFFSLIKRIFFFIVQSSCIVSSCIYSVWVFVYCRCCGEGREWNMIGPSFIQVFNQKDAQGHVIPIFLRYDWKIRFSTMLILLNTEVAWLFWFKKSFNQRFVALHDLPRPSSNWLFFFCVELNCKSFFLNIFSSSSSLFTSGIVSSLTASYHADKGII